MSSPAYAPLPSGPSAPIPNPSYDPTPTPPKLPSPRRLAFYAAVPLLYTLVLLILPNPPRTPPSSSPGDRNDTLPLPLDIFPSFTSIAFVHLVLVGLLGSLPWTSLFLLAPETKLDHYGVQWSEGNVIVVSNFVAWTSYLVYGGRSPDLDSQAFVCFCMVMVHIFGLMGLNICESPVPLHLWRKREREREKEREELTPPQSPSFALRRTASGKDWSSQCYKERVAAGLEVPRVPVEGIQMQTVRPPADVEAARAEPPQTRDLLVRLSSLSTCSIYLIYPLQPI
jgi:hypothetical protein